jgi:Domain of unknown function (DUF1990)
VFSLPGPPSLPHRALIVARWPAGIVHAAWRYVTRSTPVRHVEIDGDRTDLPSPLHPDVVDERIQHEVDGVGPLLHRHYSVTVDGATTGAAELMSAFAGRPNRAAPATIATFVKTRGEPGALDVGDEFLIRMPGPWDGPVRVVETGPASFRLATLDGHLEAGQIEFRARDEGGALVVEIESWACSGDRLSHLLYNHVGLAKEIQLHLWVETLLGLVRRSGGRVRDGVAITTRSVAPSVLPDEFDAPV